MKVMRENEMRRELLKQVEGYDTDSAAARAFGVSRSYLCHVLHGRRPITDLMAHCLGYAREFLYVPYPHLK